MLQLVETYKGLYKVLMELGILGVGSCKSASVDLVWTILAEEADWPGNPLLFFPL